MNSDINSSFSTNIPNLQMAWDSTSLGTLKECPRKYQYTMVLGRASREESVHLTFGAHYHAALERYDHSRSAGADHDTAQRAALRYCFEATVVRLPGGGWRPWASDDPNKNRATLVRSVVWYLEQFENDPLKTVQLANGKPAVELSFRYESSIVAPDGSHFWICGHIDRLVELDGTIHVLDRKTSKTTLSPETFAKFSPDNQMSLYDFSSQVVWSVPVKGIILDAAQVAVGFTRFSRGFVNRTKGQKEEWYRDAAYWIGQAADFAQNNYWPMNDKSCGNYGGCPFRPVCAKGPETREAWLKASTVARLWDPQGSGRYLMGPEDPHNDRIFNAAVEGGPLNGTTLSQPHYLHIHQVMHMGTLGCGAQQHPSEDVPVEIVGHLYFYSKGSWRYLCALPL